jgi:hypothetical protein
VYPCSGKSSSLCFVESKKIQAECIQPQACFAAIDSEGKASCNVNKEERGSRKAEYTQSKAFSEAAIQSKGTGTQSQEEKRQVEERRKREKQ